MPRRRGESLPESHRENIRKAVQANWDKRKGANPMSETSRGVAEQLAKKATQNPCANPSCCPRTAHVADDIEGAINAAVEQERERCARVAENVDSIPHDCDEHGMVHTTFCHDDIAAAIRRSNHDENK